MLWLFVLPLHACHGFILRSYHRNVVVGVLEAETADSLRGVESLGYTASCAFRQVCGIILKTAHTVDPAGHFQLDRLQFRRAEYLAEDLSDRVTEIHLVHFTLAFVGRVVYQILERSVV